jgi:hypothetical protein
MQVFIQKQVYKDFASHFDSKQVCGHYATKAVEKFIDQNTENNIILDIITMQEKGMIRRGKRSLSLTNDNGHKLNVNPCDNDQKAIYRICAKANCSPSLVVDMSLQSWVQKGYEKLIKAIANAPIMTKEEIAKSDEEEAKAEATSKPIACEQPVPVEEAKPEPVVKAEDPFGSYVDRLLYRAVEEKILQDKPFLARLKEIIKGDK